MSRIDKILLEFQSYIMEPPVSPQKAHEQACRADDATIKHWRETWLSNIKINKDNFGSFKDNGIGLLHGIAENRPAIIAGAGPSLKHVAHKLKDRPKGMLLVSCLHNFHYLEEAEADVDYYVTLDAGPITIKEVSEGGSKSESEYWDMTEGKTLIAYIGTHPDLLRKWKGKIYFYNAPIPNEEINNLVSEIEPFHSYIESGGCVLGTCMFFAKGYLGSQVSIFVGADFSFSNTDKTMFHAWNSDYDKNIGHCINAVDVFGNKVKTWLSYYNFKLFFEVAAQRVPGIYINATEGGILGAHRDGNIIHIKQMWLDQVYDMFSIERHKKGQALNPEICDGKVLI